VVSNINSKVSTRSPLTVSNWLWGTASLQNRQF